MKFSEMLVEYLDLRGEDEADTSDYDFYRRRNERRGRMQDLLEMMDEKLEASNSCGINQ